MRVNSHGRDGTRGYKVAAERLEFAQPGSRSAFACRMLPATLRSAVEKVRLISQTSQCDRPT
jgi:hypothetical protein